MSHDQIISREDALSSPHKKPVHPPNVRTGDRIRLKNGLTGSVRFKGTVEFSDEEYLGLELDYKHYNGGSGEVQGRLYFTVKKRRGYFAKCTEVARILTSSEAKMLKEMKKMKPLKGYPNRGDRVKTIKGKLGTVRYVGTAMFAPKSGMLIGMFPVSK